MRPSTWVKLAGSVAGFCISLPCAAQSAEAASPTVVHLKGAEPGMTFEVSHRGQTTAGTRCSDPCAVTARPGRYELRAFRGDAALGSAGLKVTGPATFEVSPPNVGRRQTGLALGVTGAALVVAGVAAVIYGTAQRHDCGFDETCKSRYTSTMWLGAAGVGVGGALTSVGFVLFGTSRSPKVRLIAQPRSPTEGSLAAAMTF